MTQDAAPSFTQLCQALRGAPMWTTRGMAHWISMFTVRLGRVDVRATPRFGSKGGFQGASFSVDLPRHVTDAPITLRLERELDRLGKRLGINREVQTGHDAFDRAIYIESSASDDTILRALSGTAVRAAVLSLLESGGVFKSVMIGAGASDNQNGVISADVDTGALSQFPAVWRGLSDIARVADAFGIVAGPADGPYGRGRGMAERLVPAQPMRWIRTTVATGVAAAFGILALALPTRTTLDALPSYLGVGAGVVAWVIAVAVLVVFFRGRSTSLRTVIAFSLGYLVLLPFGAKVFQRINADADGGRAQKHRGVARVVVQRKGPNVVRLDVLWRAGTPNVTVGEGDVHGGLFFPSSGDRDVIVTTHPGAFGAEWISDITLAD